MSLTKKNFFDGKQNNKGTAHKKIYLEISNFSPNSTIAYIVLHDLPQTLIVFSVPLGLIIALLMVSI